MVCDPIPQLLVFHRCRCETSPVRKWLQGALSLYWHSELQDPSTRGLHMRWGGCLATELLQVPYLQGDALCWLKMFKNWSIGNKLFHLLDCTVTSLETQGLLGGMVRYFQAKVYLKGRRGSKINFQLAAPGYLRMALSLLWRLVQTRECEFS